MARNINKETAEALDQGELLVQDLDHRGQRVGRAGGIGEALGIGG